MQRDAHKKNQTGLAIAAALVVAAFVPTQAGAAPVSVVAGDKVKLYDILGEGTTSGGAFKVDVQGKGGSDDFHTFCLEHNESFSYGELLTVLAVNTGAVKGGVSGQTSANFDPLDGRTAWLYTQYSSGSLAGYAYDNASGNALQNAIWFLEDEIGSVSGLAQTFVTAANASGWSTLVGSTWVTNTIGNVLVLNLVHADGTVSQDQLYITAVPEPETYAMLLAGLGLMGFVARRRKSHGLRG